ncbi:MAG: 30S ribosomal protein S8 [Candidatus Parvarchaeota archaeon]|jgi:small subunit ribosomal protein S8|nr:30S ribosomal protein S8 [Candidatus Parvarchaeota archaeon]
MADILSNVLNVIDVSRSVGHRECVINPTSKLIINLLEILKQNKYLEGYEPINDSKGGFIKVTISENLNKCKAIRPRVPIKAEEITKYEKRFLPAFGFGIIILSTNSGLITNDEAKKNRKGGNLLAYVY